MSPHDLPCWREVFDRAPTIKGRDFAAGADLVRKWCDSDARYGVENVTLNEGGVFIKGTNTSVLAALLNAAPFSDPIHARAWYAEVVAGGARVPVFLFDTSIVGPFGGDVA